MISLIKGSLAVLLVGVLAGCSSSMPDINDAEFQYHTKLDKCYGIITEDRKLAIFEVPCELVDIARE